MVMMEKGYRTIYTLIHIKKGVYNDNKRWRNTRINRELI